MQVKVLQAEHDAASAADRAADRAFKKDSSDAGTHCADLAALAKQAKACSAGDVSAALPVKPADLPDALWQRFLRWLEDKAAKERGVTAAAAALADLKGLADYLHAENAKCGLAMYHSPSTSPCCVWTAGCAPVAQ